MTPETRETRRQVIDQLNAALRVVQALSAGTLTWRMSIPAKPDSDPDLVISAALSSAITELAAALPASPVGAREGQACICADDNVRYGLLNCPAHPKPIAAPEGQEAETPRGWQGDHFPACPRPNHPDNPCFCANWSKSKPDPSSPTTERAR